MQNLPKSIEIVHKKENIKVKKKEETSSYLSFSLKVDHPFLIDRLLKKVKWKSLNLSKACESIQKEFELDLTALYHKTPSVINDKNMSMMWTKTLLRYKNNSF